MTPFETRLIEDMKLFGYSQRTQDTYLSAVRKLCRHVQKPVEQITNEELREYLLWHKDKYATGHPNGLSQRKDDIPPAAPDPKPVLCRCCGQPMLAVSTIPRSRQLSEWPHAPPAGADSHPGYRKPDPIIHHTEPGYQPQD